MLNRLTDEEIIRRFSVIREKTDLDPDLKSLWEVVLALFEKTGSYTQGCPSRNYLVTQTASDRFHCEVMIQDGWERWDESSLEKAKESVIRAADVLNGTAIDEDNISIKLLPSLVSRDLG